MRTKYITIVKLIEKQINEGSFEFGNKLPSIRSLSKELKVSIGTIQHAYTLLEEKGIIFSKNRSGYYINKNSEVFFELPSEKKIESQPEEVNILETSISVMTNSEQKIKYHLGGAVPNIEAKAVRRIHSSMRKYAHYTPNEYEGPQGYLHLRKQIARRSMRTGKSYSKDEIIITTGCQEALSIALQITSEPGDLIAVESPGYYGMLQTLEVFKRKVLEIPVCPANGMDINYLESMLNKYLVKAIIINPAFSNPSGYTYNDDQKKGICALLKKFDIPLIEDDVFADLGKGESRPKTIHSFDTEGNVILCSSFSKTISQDIRIGWLVAGRFFKKARAYKYVSTLGTPGLQQYALAHYLTGQSYEKHLSHISIEYSNKHHFFLQLLSKYFPGDIKVSRPTGGYLSWIKLPTNIDSLQLYKDAAKKSIGITPGELFSASGRFKNYIRLNYGYIKQEKMEEAIAKLGRLITI